MPDAELQRFFAGLSERTGLPGISPAEAEVVLDLARVVAHGAERRYAPVAAYAAGLAISARDTGTQRSTRLRAVLAEVQRMLTEGPATEDRT